MNATSRLSRSSFATATTHVALFAATSAALSCGTPVERVRPLTRLNISEFRDDVEAFRLGESLDGSALGHQARGRIDLGLGGDSVVGNQRQHNILRRPDFNGLQWHVHTDVCMCHGSANRSRGYVSGRPNCGRWQGPTPDSLSRQFKRLAGKRADGLSAYRRKSVFRRRANKRRRRSSTGSAGSHRPSSVKFEDDDTADAGEPSWCPFLTTAKPVAVARRSGVQP